jgi:hypothetical protein
MLNLVCTIALGVLSWWEFYVALDGNIKVGRDVNICHDSQSMCEFLWTELYLLIPRSLLARTAIFCGVCLYWYFAVCVNELTEFYTLTVYLSMLYHLQDTARFDLIREGRAAG